MKKSARTKSTKKFTLEILPILFAGLISECVYINDGFARVCQRFTSMLCSNQCVRIHNNMSLSRTHTQISTHTRTSEFSQKHTFRWLRLMRLVVSTLSFSKLRIGAHSKMTMRCRCLYHIHGTRKCLEST